MKINSRTIFLITAIIVGIVGVFILYNTFACKRISCLTLKDKESYKVENIYEENEYIYRAFYKNQNNLLRAEIRKNSTQKEADLAVQTQLARTKGLFEPAAAPYPGEISDVIACGDEFKPVYKTLKQNGITISYFEGFLNDRLVFGSCVDDQAKYHDTLAMFYCAKQKNFYQIEIITPSDEFRNNPNKKAEILKSLACK